MELFDVYFRMLWTALIIGIVGFVVEGLRLDCKVTCFDTWLGGVIAVSSFVVVVSAIGMIWTM